MPDINYTNPTSIRPAYGWQPQGALAGMMSSQDRQRYTDVGSLQDLMSMMTAATQKEELVQGAPVRAAERGQKISTADLATMLNNAKMGTPGYGSTLALGAMGEARTNQARGDLAMGTLQSDIQAKNSQNETSIGSNALTTQSNLLQYFDRALPQLSVAESQGPLQAQMAYDEMRKGLPPQLQQIFPPKYGPEVKKAMAESYQRLVNSVEQQRKLAEVKAKGDQDARVAAIQGQNQYDVEFLRQSEATKRTGLTVEQKKQVKQATEIMAKYLEKISSGEPVTDMETKAFMIAQQVANNAAAARASGQAMGFSFLGQNQGFPTPTPVDPNTFNGTGTAVGQVMEFKQGKYKKIKPGPDNDESTWAKQ